MKAECLFSANNYGTQAKEMKEVQKFQRATEDCGLLDRARRTRWKREEDKRMKGCPGDDNESEEECLKEWGSPALFSQSQALMGPRFLSVGLTSALAPVTFARRQLK